MYVTILDLILILILFVFVAFGFTMGLIQAIGALAGVVLGTWVAGMYYEQFASWLEPILLGQALSARIIAFVVIFTLANRLTGLLFWGVNKAFNLISIIPFTKSLNRLLGAVLGLVEGVLAIGIILYFVNQLPIIQWVSDIISESMVANALMSFARILVPLLPEIINQVNPFA